MYANSRAEDGTPPNLGRIFWCVKDVWNIMENVPSASCSAGCAQIHFAVQSVLKSQAFRQVPTINKSFLIVGPVGVYHHSCPWIATTNERKPHAHSGFDLLLHKADKSYHSSGDICDSFCYGGT